MGEGCSREENIRNIICGEDNYINERLRLGGITEESVSLVRE